MTTKHVWCSWSLGWMFHQVLHSPFPVFRCLPKMTLDLLTCTCAISFHYCKRLFHQQLQTIQDQAQLFCSIWPLPASNHHGAETTSPPAKAKLFESLAPEPSCQNMNKSWRPCDLRVFGSRHLYYKHHDSLEASIPMAHAWCRLHPLSWLTTWSKYTARVSHPSRVAFNLGPKQCHQPQVSKMVLQYTSM